MLYRHRVLTLLFFLSMVTYLDRVCIAVAGPEMQKDLGLSPSQWGWVVGIFALSYAIFEIPSGALGDRIGPRKVLTRIVIWWSAFTSLTGLVSNFYLLLATRFAFGMGEAGAYPNASSSISRWFPLAERARAHGTVWMASRIGGALTPLLVVPIVAAYGWRMAFYLFGLIGVVWAVVWFWWYRDYPAEMPGVTRDELAHIGEGSARAAHQALPWARVVRSPNFWAILLMYHAYCWGSYFYVSWMPTYLRLGRGFTADEMKIYAMLPFLAGAIGNLTGGAVSDVLVRRIGLKVGRRAVAATGLAMSALCLFGTAVVDNRLLAVAFLTFGYFSMDCMLPVSWAVCVDVGKRHAGAMTGAMNTAGQFGSFLSSIAFGALVDAFGGRYDVPLILFSACLALSALIFLRIDASKPLMDDVAI
jgi:MFS transporter, ACS family, glucarate transporter